MADYPIPTRARTALTVPNDAVDAFYASAHAFAEIGMGVSDEQIARIARPILAAELRRMAAAVAPQASVVDGSDAMTRRACAAELVARAGELDGGAS